jgi:hypothetical protein
VGGRPVLGLSGRQGGRQRKKGGELQLEWCWLPIVSAKIPGVEKRGRPVLRGHSAGPLDTYGRQWWFTKKVRARRKPRCIRCPSSSSFATGTGQKVRRRKGPRLGPEPTLLGFRALDSSVKVIYRSSGSILEARRYRAWNTQEYTDVRK